MWQPLSVVGLGPLELIAPTQITCPGQPTWGEVAATLHDWIVPWQPGSLAVPWTVNFPVD